MRHLFDFESREQTERFLAYLLTLDISGHVEQESGTPPRWSLWIREEDRLEHAKQELNDFLAAPNDSKYDDAISKARSILLQQEREQRDREKRFHQGRRRDPYSTGNLPPPITLTLIIACVVLGLMTNLMNIQPQDKQAARIARQLQFVDMSRYVQSGDPGASLKQGELWRVITPAFLHAGPLHLLVNMLSLASLGRLTERLEGRWRYIVILLICAIGAHLLQGFAPSRVFGLKALGGSPNFVGISGVVLGLFGYLAVKTKLQPRLGFSFPPDAYFSVIFIIVVGMIGGMHLANLAHIGGLLTGAALGYLWNRRSA